MTAFSPQQSRVKVGFPLQWPVCAKSPCLYGDMWCSVAAFSRSALKGPSRATPAWIRIPTSPALDYLLSQCTSAPISRELLKARNSFRRSVPASPRNGWKIPSPVFFSSSLKSWINPHRHFYRAKNKYLIWIFAVTNIDCIEKKLSFTGVDGLIKKIIYIYIYKS